MGPPDQGLQSRDRRPRNHRKKPRGRSPATRDLAATLRARRAAVSFLSRAARAGREAHRDPERTRWADARAGQPRCGRGQRGPRAAMSAADDLKQYLDDRRSEIDDALLKA